MQPILAQLNPKLSIDIHLSIPIKSIPIKSIRYNSSRYGHDTCIVDLWKNLYRVLALLNLNRGLQSNLNTCVQYIHIFQMELGREMFIMIMIIVVVNTKCFTKTKSVIFNIYKCLLVSSQRLFEDDNI